MRSFLAIVVAVSLLASATGCVIVGVCDCDPGSTYRGAAGAFGTVATTEPSLKPVPSTQLPGPLPTAPAVAGQ